MAAATMVEDLTREIGERRPSIFADLVPQRYTVYEAELDFDRWLMGGIPKDPKLMAGWIRSKAGVSDEVEVLEMMRRHLRELGVDVQDGADFDALVKASEGIAEERHTCGFKSNGDGLYVESRVVMAMLKEAVNIAYPYQSAKDKAEFRWGPTGKAPRSYFAEHVRVEPDDISVGRDSPDGIYLWIGHPKTPQGRSSTLTYFEYAERPTISFQLRVRGDVITPEQWANIWLTAQDQGLWALRSQGFGRFRIVRWEQLDT